MAFPIQLPHVVTEHMNVGAPGNNIGPGARGREKRWTRYAEHNRPKGRPSQPRSLLGRANFGSDGTESSEGPDRLRTNPRQIRRNPYPEERVADGDEPGKHGRLVGRQSNSPVIGEGVNPGGPGGTGVGNGIGNGNGNGVGNGVANGVANGNGNGTGNALPLPGTEEDEEESESEDEELEEETDDDLESEAEDEVDEEEDDNALEEEPAVPESTQGQNKGKISPTQTGSIDIEPSQTAAAIVTSAAPTIAATTAACDASVSPSSDQCEGPEPDLLQPFQKAAIATGATISGIVALLVFAFFFMRSRHGSKLGTWPCVRRYRRRGRFRLNSTAESGITILPPPPFQKEDPWTITKERESWAGTRNPPEKKKFTLGPSKLQNAPLIRRILGAPLESNPVSSPPSITSPLHPKSPTGTGAAVTPSHDPDLLSPRDNHRLTISTRSSQAIPEDEQPEISDTRSVRSNFRPQNARRLPGVSYFSWTMSSPTTTAPNKHQSFMSKSAASNKRETMTTVDSEPPRFRTITSWVNQQRKRTNGISDAPPVPSKDNSFNPPLTPRVADSPLKQSMGQSSDTPTKPPLLLSKPTPPHPPIRAAPLPASIPDASPARENQEHIPPVPPLPSANFVPPPPPTPLKPRADNKYHSRTVSVSTNDTTTPPASMHKKNASSTASSLPTVFKHHPGDKVEITRI